MAQSTVIHIVIAVYSIKAALIIGYHLFKNPKNKN